MLNNPDTFSPSQYNGPSEFVHLHNHTVFSALDGVATPEQYAEQCFKRGYPAMSATEHGHMASVPDMYLAFRKYKLKYIPGCFLPNQSVFLESGVKEMESISLQDKALTHKNNFCDINNIQIRDYDGELVRIKAWCVEDQLCTPEHPFLIREVTRNEKSKGVWEEDIIIRWCKAGELFREKYHRTYDSKRSNDRTNKRRYRFYLCVPRPNGSGINNLSLRECFLRGASLNMTTTSAGLPDIIDSVSYEHSRDCGKTYKTTKNVNLPEYLELDDDLLWIMGLWLAEGTIKDGIHFHLCSDEFDFYERIADYFAQFGIKTSHCFRNGDGESTPRNALDVSVYSTYFGRLFEALFGKYFDKKKIPTEWLHNLSRQQSVSLLNGLFDGDAKVGKSQSYLKLNNKTLIWQARILLSAIGQYSAITEAPCNNSDNLSYIIRRRESGHFYYDYDEEFIYLPVYDIENEQYTGSVYNLEINSDNSYNTGVAVHNCEIYFNDFEPERQRIEIAGHKVRSPEWRKNNPELASRIARNRHLTVLCKNEVGYHNLLKLTTQAYETGLFGMGQTQYNRIWFDKLCEFKEGLIILSGCLNGPVCHELRYRKLKDKEGNVVAERSTSEALDAAVKWVKKFKAVFGDDYYIELQMPGIDAVDKFGEATVRDEDVFRWLVSIADRYKIKLVLANDCHYLERKDFELQKLMMAVAQGLTMDSPDLFHVNSSEQYMKTRAELWARFKSCDYSNGVDDRVFEEMCDNTLLIADKCELFKPDTSPKIPEIDNADNEIKTIVAKRLKSGGFDKDKRRFLIDGLEVTYVEQAKIELNRFIDKGFSSYFLITRELVKYGRQRGWPFSPRGSAGGSLVCYLMGIHTLDPMLWGLSFNRFLSPSRGGYMLNIEMPND